MKVASSLTLYSFSCCTIKYYYYYYNILCYSLAISRVCSFFRSLVSSAFQKKKEKKLFVIISISKTRFSHIKLSRNERTPLYFERGKVRFLFFSVSVSVSVSVCLCLFPKRIGI
jgi:hypothetical protein